MAQPKYCPLRTYMQTLSETKRNMLNELGERVKDELEPDDDDFLLLRFLKARNFDIEKAEKMLSEHLKFMKKLNYEMVKGYEPPEVLVKYTSIMTLGVDNEGDSVTYIMASAHDFKGLTYSGTLSDFTKFCVHKINKHHEVSKRKSKHEAMGSFIFDLENISFSFATSRLVLRQQLSLIQMYQSNFPETLKACYVINVPSFFNFWYNLYKQVIDPFIVQKIHIFGKDGYQDELLKVMDPDILPAYLGGKRTDDDGNPECPNLIRRGFLKVPTSYYLSANNVEIDDEPGVESICIRERASFDCRIRVDATKTVLKWYFRTLNYNIKFGVYYVSDDVPQTPKLNRKYAKASNKTLRKAGFETIFPVDYVESHIIPERGEYTCEKVGTYVFRFDNTFSWMTPKELTYKVDPILPKQTKSVKIRDRN